MKRAAAGLLIGVMVLGALTGCGGNQGEQAAQTEESSGEGGGSADITLVLSNRDEFVSALEAGALKAAEELGVNLITQDAQSDTSKMIQFVESARNAGQKAVIINIIDPQTAPQVIEAAGDMKIVFMNKQPADIENVLNDNIVYVGSDEMESGKYQGEFLSDFFKAQGKDEIKYLMVNGVLGDIAQIQRTESCLQAFEDQGMTAVEATAPVVADWDRANAQDLISPLVNTVDFDCIIANNDAMALGAAEAMEQQGGDLENIPIVGIDATVDGCQAISEGRLAMTVFQDADGQGFGALTAAVNLIEGNPINEGSEYELDETGHIMWVPFEPVTAENVEDYM